MPYSYWKHISEASFFAHAFFVLKVLWLQHVASDTVLFALAKGFLLGVGQKFDFKQRILQRFRSLGILVLELDVWPHMRYRWRTSRVTSWFRDLASRSCISEVERFVPGSGPNCLSDQGKRIDFSEREHVPRWSFYFERIASNWTLVDFQRNAKTNQKFLASVILAPWYQDRTRLQISVSKCNLTTF